MQHRPDSTALLKRRQRHVQAVIGAHRFEIELLLDEAPHHAALLWRLAGAGLTLTASHAVHTGPEISCPIDAGALPFPVDVAAYTPENAVHAPQTGDVVMVCAVPGRWGDVPAAPLIDIGFFYGSGGHLTFPFGKVEGSVAARCQAAALPALRAAARDLEGGGAASLQLAPAP